MKNFLEAPILLLEYYKLFHISGITERKKLLAPKSFVIDSSTDRDFDYYEIRSFNGNVLRLSASEKIAWDNALGPVDLRGARDMEIIKLVKGLEPHKQYITFKVIY
jgi:hypothetical protein